MQDEKVGDITPTGYRLVTAIQRHYFQPTFLGSDSLDLSRPALWVGNHTLYGMLDAPLMGHHLFEKGVKVHALGDRGHFSVPVWRWALKKVGVVLGTPENCAELMRSGKHVLVFPGGAREVMRRKGEDYQLIWKQRTGFARMAIEHGYDIIPFGSLGPDEALDILVDADDVMNSRAWSWLNKYAAVNEMTRNGDVLPPIVKGVGPTLIPRPQKFYFGFGERIPTSHLNRNTEDKSVLWQVREEVAMSIENQLDRLEAYREHDKENNWGPLRRWLTKSSRREASK